MQDPLRNLSRPADEPAARLEHIAIEVVSLEAALSGLEVLGIRFTGPPQCSGGYTSVWTTAETSGGVMYQFTEKDDASR
jgi:hypothetical protein